MSRRSGHLTLRYESLPKGKDGGRIRQQIEHALEPREFESRSVGRHAEAVLTNGSGCDNPEFHKVLRNYMKSPTLAG
jgi:hypothetical protein